MTVESLVQLTDSRGPDTSTFTPVELRAVAAESAVSSSTEPYYGLSLLGERGNEFLAQERPGFCSRVGVVGGGQNPDARRFVPKWQIAGMVELCDHETENSFSGTVAASLVSPFEAIKGRIDQAPVMVGRCASQISKSFAGLTWAEFCVGPAESIFGGTIRTRHYMAPNARRTVSHSAPDFLLTNRDRSVRALIDSALMDLANGWAGPGSLAPSAAVVRDALRLADLLPRGTSLPDVEVDDSTGHVSLIWWDESRRITFALSLTGSEHVIGTMSGPKGTTFAKYQPWRAALSDYTLIEQCLADYRVVLLLRG